MGLCRIGCGRICNLYGGYWNETATPIMNSHMRGSNKYLQYMRYLTREDLLPKSHRNTKIRLKYHKWKKLY